MKMAAVILENHDVFGNGVNIVSRVQAIAPLEHIYITQRLYDEVKSNKEVQFRFIGHEQLKGVKDKTPLYKIVCACGKNDNGANMFDNVSDAIKPVRKHDNGAGRGWTKPLRSIPEPMEVFYDRQNTG